MSSRDSFDEPHKTSKGQPPIEREEAETQSKGEHGTLPNLPDVEKSHIYLVEEEKPESAYKLFSKALAQGMPGLCVTRVYPEILTQKLDLGDSTILWLSNTGKEDSVRPRDLERLSILLEQFLTDKKGVVLLDGIEYLVTNNDFVTVLRLIQSMRDLVAMNMATMIVSLNPSTLGFQELNLLEREMDSVLRFQDSETEEQKRFHGR